MGGSIYCADRDKITSGEAAAFRALPSDGSSTLMDASESNRDVILSSVDCDLMYSRAFYPVDFEDSISSLALRETP